MSDLRMELIQGQLNDIEENVRSIKATWGNTIMTLDNIKSSLKAYRQKAIDEAYQKGYDEAKLIYQNPNAESDYQRGLDDAWEAARKICNEPEDGGLPAGAVVELFGRNGTILGCSAQNAINKIKAYEEQQKPDLIKVGDEVVALRGKAIVIRRYKDMYRNDEEACEYWYYDFGKIDHDSIDNLRKTGRHFPQVGELLKAIKGGAE